jgi:hypothetical protein
MAKDELWWYKTYHRTPMSANYRGAKPKRLRSFKQMKDRQQARVPRTPSVDSLSHEEQLALLRKLVEERGNA